MAKKRKTPKPQRQEPTQPTTPINPNMDPGERALRALYGDTGFEAGMALGQQFYGDGALGRVSETVPGQEEYLNQLRGGLGGYTSEQYQAQREQAARGQNSNYLTARDQLAKAQARGRVYGAAGAAQQANLSMSNQQSKDTLEQDLMVKNVDEMQRRLQTFGAANSAAQAATLERQKLNLGQQAAETVGRTGAFTGAAGQSMIEAENRRAQDIQRRALAAISGGSGSSRSTNRNQQQSRNRPQRARR